MLGLSRLRISLLSSSASAVGGSFSPSSLFGAGEQGAWYDPSDLTTLFQDSTGTTPVTAAGQQVGLMLDKSGRANHATQSNSAQRPTYGVVPATGRRNLLTFTEQFDSAAWTKVGSNVVANSTTAPDSTTTADTLRLNAGTALATAAVGLFTSIVTYFSQPSASTLSAGTHTYSLYVNAASGLTHIQLRVSTSPSLTPAINSAAMIVRLADGFIVANDNSLGTVQNAGNGWWRIILPFTAVAAIHHVGCWFWNSTSISSAAGTEGYFVWGAQLETGSTATAYQRVGTAFDVTEAGVPSMSYLSFDGSDDGMATGNIVPGTDKMQISVAVQKLSDATQGVVSELSATIASNNGTFLLASPDAGTTATYGFDSKGTTQVDAVATGFAAPVTSVVTGLGDISGDSAIIRVNGVQADADLGDQGTGNYLSYPVYIGRRGGSSLPANMRLYQYILRFGANLTASQIDQMEAFNAKKAGVTL